MQWRRSYRKFANRIRDAYADGYGYIANFDLTAFYDLIDHHVLSHFLKEIGVDEDTIGFLLDCLKVWTSSTWSNGPQNIYHEHGIPQGPPSGMLSEAVLKHIDDAGEQGRKTIYLRYVDDIKILAKNEDELRRKLIKLDITAKEIGLFPQTAKINIRQISNPDEEVKSVSRPPEPSLKPVTDQKRLVARIRELSRNGKIEPANTTRFKYLLSHAEPTHRLNSRIVKILRRHPDLAPALCGYVAGYKTLPSKFASDIIDYLTGPELYHSVHGALLRACLGRCRPAEAGRLGRFCADRLVRPKRGSIPVQASYKEALIAWALKTNTISFAEYDRVVFAEPDWWVKKSALRELSGGLYGDATYVDFINRCLRTPEPEVARMAAARVLQDSIKLANPYGNVETTAKQMLKASGVIRTIGQPQSRINQILGYIIKRPQTPYDWKRFFGAQHRHAEKMMIFLKRNRESNIDAFLVQLDSFSDLIISEVYRRHKPGKTYPPYGSALKDPVLAALIPTVMACFSNLHQLRLESTTAHPRSLKTGKATRRLKHRDFYKIRQDLVSAFDELERNVIS